MRHKKITAVAFALILGLSTMVPAKAGVPHPSTTITERFHVYKGKGGVASYYAPLKGSTNNFMNAYANVTPNTVRWGTKEVLHVMGLTTINTQATYAGVINQPGQSTNMVYMPGHGTRNCNYGIRATYPSTNGGTNLDVQVRWTP